MTLVRAEQISANDEDVLVLEWAPTDGDQVRAGEVVGTLETTKAGAGTGVTGGVVSSARLSGKANVSP